MDRIRFQAQDIENEMAQLSEGQIDQLPFGVIQIDAQGTILLYNTTEGEISGRQPQNMLGRNFFSDIAPCTRTDTLYGRFREGVQKGHLDTVCEYTFDYKMAPTKVKVHLKKARNQDRYWIFVKRL